MSVTAITFDDFLAELSQEPVSVVSPDQLFPELFEMGRNVGSLESFIRFDGVRQDLMREVRGGLCTLEQAVAYLENFELYLVEEAERTTSTPE